TLREYGPVTDVGANRRPPKRATGQTKSSKARGTEVVPGNCASIAVDRLLLRSLAVSRQRSVVPVLAGSPLVTWCYVDTGELGHHSASAKSTAPRPPRRRAATPDRHRPGAGRRLLRPARNRSRRAGGVVRRSGGFRLPRALPGNFLPHRRGDADPGRAVPGRRGMRRGPRRGRSGVRGGPVRAGTLPRTGFEP